MKEYIYIDDTREDYSKVPDGMAIIHARTYAEAINALKQAQDRNYHIIVDFDHDLGTGKTGYDIAKYIVREGYPTAHLRFHIHSMNPVGAQNIRQLLARYNYTEF